MKYKEMIIDTMQNRYNSVAIIQHLKLLGYEYKPVTFDDINNSFVLQEYNSDDPRKPYWRDDLQYGGAEQHDEDSFLRNVALDMGLNHEHYFKYPHRIIYRKEIEIPMPLPFCFQTNSDGLFHERSAIGENSEEKIYLITDLVEMSADDVLIADGHNPDNITLAQLGANQGWRLLNHDEIAVRESTKDIELWRSSKKDWFRGVAGYSKKQTYRTKRPSGYFLPQKEEHLPTSAEEILACISEYKKFSKKFINILETHI